MRARDSETRMETPAAARVRRSGPDRPPQLPGFHVPRTHLIDALDDAGDVPVTALIAPAGSGKSVLLASWVRARCPEAVWVSCCEWGPEQFWVAVVGALHRAQPDRWIEAVDLVQEPNLDLRALVAALVAELSDGADPVVLVLDDLGRVRGVGPWLELLAASLPPPSRLLVGSRSEAPLPVARMRAHGLLHEIRGRDLRFTDEEAAALLEGLGVHLPPEMVNALTRRAEGWVAGIQLAGVAARHAEDPAAFVDAFSGTVRVVSDFLLEEVLLRLDADTRDFLLTTSILDELTPGVCDAVAGTYDSATRLRDLFAAGLFLVAAEEPETYRYHALFRDLLRLHLRLAGADGERKAHHRAALWFEMHGAPGPAIEHALLSGDEDLAFALFHQTLGQEFVRYASPEPRGILEILTRGSADLAPSRCVSVACALALAGRSDEAQALIDRAMRQPDQLSDLDQDRRLVAQSLMALLRGDPRAAEADVARLRDLDRDDEWVRGGSLVCGLMARLWFDDPAGARRKVAEAVPPLANRLWYTEVVVGSSLAQVACVEGGLREAAQLADRAFEVASAAGLDDHPGLVGALGVRGRLLFERGELAGAEGALEQSLAVGERTRQSLAFQSGVTLARVWLAKGRVGDARDGLASARELLGRAPPDSPLLLFADTLDARLALALGDQRRYRQVVDRLPDGFRRSLLLARGHLAADQPGRAVQALDAAGPATLRQQLDVAALRARAAHDLQRADAEERLRDCVALARPERFTFALVDEEMRPLASRLGVLLRSGPLGKFEQQVLALLDRVIPGGRPGSRSVALEPLSERELLVLRYLASRMTSVEIAAELFISINTLKTHRKAIYRKLGASSRRQAVAVARRLRLL